MNPSCPFISALYHSSCGLKICPEKVTRCHAKVIKHFEATLRKNSSSTHLEYVALPEAELVVCCCSEIIFPFGFHQNCPKGFKGEEEKEQRDDQGVHDKCFYTGRKNLKRQFSEWGRNLQFVKAGNVQSFFCLKHVASKCMLDKIRSLRAETLLSLWGVDMLIR